MGKVMVVTGASRGIGAAVARLAATHGYDVAVNYRSSAAAAEQVAADCRAKGVRAVTIRADVADPDAVTAMFAEIDRTLGPVDVLVNNAGLINRQVPVGDITPADLADIFAANVYSAFYCAREAVRRMSTARGGKGGAIVNVSSAAARHGGLPKESHYAATKGAIDSFTVGFAKEVAREGIRVNAVRPGIIVTEIHEAHGGQATIDAVAPTIPLGRAGTPEEVAEAVLWLASLGASYVQGAIIEVSGGR